MNRFTWMFAALALVPACKLAGSIGTGSPSSPHVSRMPRGGSSSSSSSSPETADAPAAAQDSSGGAKPSVSEIEIATYKIDVVAVAGCSGLNAPWTEQALEESHRDLDRAGRGLLEVANDIGYASPGWQEFATRGDAEKAVHALEQAMATYKATLDKYMACNGTWNAEQTEDMRSYLAEQDKLAAEIKTKLPAYWTELGERLTAGAGLAMYQRAQSMREQKCTGGSDNKPYYAWKDPQNGWVNYEFCDGVKVEHRPDGDWVAQTPTLNGHPEWESYMKNELEELEDARRRHELLGTAKSQAEVQRAEKAFSAAMQKFIKKYYPEKKYVDQAKKSKLEIATAN